MVANLPPELHANILSFLTGFRSTHSLRLCSLVSRDFRYLSQALLFESYTIDLRGKRGEASPSVEALKRELGLRISKYIRILTLWIEDIRISQVQFVSPTRLAGFLRTLPSLLRLRLVVRCNQDATDFPALSEALFNVLFPLVQGRTFDLEWKGPCKVVEKERLNTLLRAARRIDYLHISDTAVSELLSSSGPPLSPTHLHISSYYDDIAGVLPSQLDLSSCTSLSLASMWPSQVTITFLGSPSGILRDFHYVLPHYGPTRCLPPSIFRSLKVLENFSLTLSSSTYDFTSYQMEGLGWMLMAIPHIQEMTTVRSIRLDFGILGVDDVRSIWHIAPEFLQALPELGNAFQRIPKCKTMVVMDISLIERRGVDTQHLETVELDLRRRLRGSKDQNDIQVNIRSFKKSKRIKESSQTVFHFKWSCSWTDDHDCGCWVLP
ncbi:hypothetical protein DL96DRAFT_1681163 [Flagelloscypha sp. PMI_526]|nr:hypothetical protein DL96DRAFT_1681163 [Flagelloscypha sp. PMI_526]